MITKFTTGHVLHSVTPPGSLQASVAAVTHAPVTICNTPHLPCANPHPAAVFRQYPSIPVNTLTHEIIALQRNH